MLDKKKIVIQPKQDLPPQDTGAAGNAGIVIKPKNDAQPPEPAPEPTPPPPPPGPTPRPPGKNRQRIWIISAIAILLCSAVLYVLPDDETADDDEAPITAAPANNSPEENGQKYFINDTLYTIKPGIVSSQTTIRQTLQQLNINPILIQKLQQQTPSLGTPTSKEGKFKLLTEKGGNHQPAYFIYEIEPEWYTVIGLQPDSLFITKINRVIALKPRNLGLVITSEGLIADVLNRRLPYEVIEEIERAFAWTVDLFHLSPGDQLKISYTEKYLGDECVGIGKVFALELISKNIRYQAYNFAGKRGNDYFNEKAQTLKRSFLMSPLQIGRMSSAFSMSRKHPVTGVVKAHKGTDYAAPEGTEIQSVSNGVVERMGEDEYNGRFVKIKHDATYSTQYLHMSGYAPNLKIGSPVRQGQTIGYVGHTGQATGPHVCFRFWKNDVQVDHTQEKFPPGNSILADDLNAFTQYRDSLSAKLKDINDY